MAATTAGATTTEGGRRFARRRPVPVRLRITAAVVVLAGLALAGAGFVVYALESQRIDRNLDEEITQELDGFEDFARQNRALDPQAVIRLNLASNVPSPDELSLGFWDAEPQLVSDGSAHRELADLPDPTLVEAVDGLVATGGGTTDIETAYGDAIVVVKPVRSEGTDSSDAAFVLVHFQAEELDELTEMTRTYALVAGAALVALALGAWSLSGRLLRPVRELRDTAREIGDTDLTRRIPATGNDDLTDLTRTFNAMLDRLEDAFAGQREFLNAAGHELRTPLTIIRGHLELTDADDPSEVAATRELVLDEIDRMSRLIDELILLAHSRRPDFVQPTPNDISDLTDGLADKIRGLGDRQWAVDERGEGTVEIDGQRVTQAVVQLAQNAYGHTTESDTVAVGTRVKAATVTVWVRDTGVGIAVAGQERVFDRFYRGPDSRTEGSGLGLSIVRAIAEAHGGMVTVTSTPGRGATFTLTLPRRQVVP
jgi:two-component system OmpR family sensor kinase